MTQYLTAAPAVAASGILSGTGAQLIRATCYLRAVPDQPPAGLAEDVHAAYDSRGRLVDWCFGSVRPDRRASSDSFEAYRAWRGDFALDRLIGERAFTTALLSWAAGRCDLSALSVLRLSEARVDAHAALTMRLQAGRARQVLHAGADTGFGLVRPDGPEATFRALLPTDPATVLLEEHGVCLTIAPDGPALHGPSLGQPLTGITGWRLVGDRVLATGANGEAGLAGSAAEVLQVAGRHAPAVSVRRCPVSSLAAPLLVALQDVCALAGNTRSELRFHSNWD